MFSKLYLFSPDFKTQVFSKRYLFSHDLMLSASLAHVILLLERPKSYYLQTQINQPYHIKSYIQNAQRLTELSLFSEIWVSILSACQIGYNSCIYPICIRSRYFLHARLVIIVAYTPFVYVLDTFEKSSAKSI